CSFLCNIRILWNVLSRYACESPVINLDTQQPLNCNEDNSVTGKVSFFCFFLYMNKFILIPNFCSYNAHIHHSNALLLSLFFGFLGFDRIYLGYYAIGIIKMFSLGGLFVLWLVDVVLIALQLLLPADGSGYIINYYGPRVTPLRFDGATNYSIYTCVDCI
uniref:TM2 domain-containing protein n=1 Tax=Angiostrongylus cantonensis TaxID=6313 RepID=A0A0K0DD26_ANGCA